MNTDFSLEVGKLYQSTHSVPIGSSFDGSGGVVICQGDVIMLIKHEDHWLTFLCRCGGIIRWTDSCPIGMRPQHYLKRVGSGE